MSKGVSIDGWLDRKAAADFLKVTDWWLEKHAQDSEAPPYIRHGRKVWYRRDDLRAWLADQAKVAHVREASGFTLDSLYHLHHRRPDPPLPNTRELAEKYDAEHGPADVVIRREVWDALQATFTMAQRKLAKNKLRVVPG